MRNGVSAVNQTKAENKLLERQAVSVAERLLTVREVAERLAALHSNLSEHVKFEEQEVLPRLASYAVKILTRGVVLEHEEILLVQVS